MELCEDMDKFRLDGQRAVITGGGSGLGLGIAKTFVEAAVNHREDGEYWIGKAPEHPTFRLRLLAESDGSNLSATELAKFGFKGGQSLRHYIHHNIEMLEYIEEVFK